MLNIIYKISVKDSEYEHAIKIDKNVEYAYIRAIFDALLERGNNFEMIVYQDINK